MTITSPKTFKVSFWFLLFTFIQILLTFNVMSNQPAPGVDIGHSFLLLLDIIQVIAGGVGIYISFGPDPKKKN